MYVEAVDTPISLKQSFHKLSTYQNPMLYPEKYTEFLFVTIPLKAEGEEKQQWSHAYLVTSTYTLTFSHYKIK